MLGLPGFGSAGSAGLALLAGSKCRKSCKTLLGTISAYVKLQVGALLSVVQVLLALRFATFPTCSPLGEGELPQNVERVRALAVI